MRFQVGMNLTFAGRKAADGEPGYGSLEEFLDAIMEELLDLGFNEPGIGGSLATGQVEISVDVDVDSDSVEKAVVYATSSIRSAIHGAHGSTSGWDPEWGSYVTRSLDARPLEGDVLSPSHDQALGV